MRGESTVKYSKVRPGQTQGAIKVKVSSHKLLFSLSSLGRGNEMLAKGLCFNCEEQGHLTRNCPKLTTMTSKEKGSLQASQLIEWTSSTRRGLIIMNEPMTVMKSRRAGSSQKISKKLNNFTLNVATFHKRRRELEMY
jgi:uracil DNA glycosylase